MDASKIAESSGVGTCRRAWDKFCYNIDWMSAFTYGSKSPDQSEENSTASATVEDLPGTDSSDMAYTCFDEITVYFNQVPEAECCDGFLRITFKPRDNSSVFSIDPINHLLCNNKRRVFLGLKANWTVDGKTEVFEEIYDVLLNDDLPTCRGELANSTTPPEVTERPTEPPPSKALRSSIPFIILGCIVALIAICFIFSMCKKKRAEEKSQLPKRSKSKAMKSGEDENKQKEGRNRKESSDGVGDLDYLDGADAKAKKLYGAKFQEAIVENEKSK